jgi:hypothetical protein
MMWTPEKFEDDVHFEAEPGRGWRLFVSRMLDNGLPARPCDVIHWRVEHLSMSGGLISARHGDCSTIGQGEAAYQRRPLC